MNHGVNPLVFVLLNQIIGFTTFVLENEEYCTLVFKTDVLKKIVDKLDTFKTVSGGDHNASRMFLVNLPKLFSTDVIKAFKELDDDTKK